jgi:hypothetical protein
LEALFALAVPQYQGLAGMKTSIFRRFFPILERGKDLICQFENSGYRIDCNPVILNKVISPFGRIGPLSLTYKL